MTGDCAEGEEKQNGPCGYCGTVIQKCEGGTWGLQSCVGEGPCEAGALDTLPCDNGGTQTRIGGLGIDRFTSTTL